MYHKKPCYRILSFAMTLAAAVLVIIALGQMHLDTTTRAMLFNSPLTTPSTLFSSPLPTPTPKPIPLGRCSKSNGLHRQTRGDPYRVTGDRR